MKLQPTTGARFVARRVMDSNGQALATVTNVNTAMNTVTWVTDGGRKFTSTLKALTKGRRSFQVEVKSWIEHPEL